MWECVTRLIKVSIIIGTIIATLMMLGTAADVNATGFGQCSDEDLPGEPDCEIRDERPEIYCITIEENPFCNDVNICNDESDITSDHDFCIGDAVRTIPGEGSPEGTRVIEGDERGCIYTPCIYQVY